MFDTRIIRRLAYDDNFQRAIELIVDIIDGKKNYFEVKEDLEKRRKASCAAKSEETKDYAKLKAENERLTSWLASSEKQKKELCNVIHKKKEQIQTLKYMLFDEKEIPKDKFVMYYRIAQNERRTKSHRDLCTNVVKKYRQTLQEIKNIAEPFAKCYTHTCRNCEKYDSAHACCLKDINCYKYNDGSKSSCKDFVLPTKQFYQQILANVITKITKAEEE